MFLFLSSCGLFRKGEEKPKYPEERPRTEWPEERDEREKPDEPVDEEEQARQDSLDRIYPITEKQQYQVAVMLPFLYDPEDRMSGRQELISTIATEYYWGLLMAADTLRSCGIDLRLKVVDTKSDSLRIIMELPEVAEANPDLVIGPLMKQQLKRVYRYSAYNKVNFVSPLYPVEDTLRNPYFFLSIPQTASFGRRAAEWVNRHGRGRRILIMREPFLTQKSMADTFKYHLDSMYLDSLVEISSLSASLPIDSVSPQNIVFVPSDDELYVSSVLQALKNTPDTSYTLLGLSKWMDFQAITPQDWQRYNVHLLSSFWVDYESEAVKRFISEYRKRYKTEPSDFAYRGYDDMLFFGSRMLKDGKYFQRFLPDRPFPLLHSKYRLEQDSVTNGYFNQYLHVLRYNDFEIKPVR